MWSVSTVSSTELPNDGCNHFPIRPIHEIIVPTKDDFSPNRGFLDITGSTLSLSSLSEFRRLTPRFASCLVAVTYLTRTIINNHKKPVKKLLCLFGPY
jgi:hypothetical protein